MSAERSEAVVVKNRQGLHARPAAEFVKLASSYECEVFVQKEDLEVNGKSIMGVMMLAAEPGTRLEIRAVGEDCREAVEALVALVEGRFGEDGEEPADGSAATGGAQ